MMADGSKSSWPTTTGDRARVARTQRSDMVEEDSMLEVIIPDDGTEGDRDVVGWW
jgi:hypothetical protein